MLVDRHGNSGVANSFLVKYPIAYLSTLRKKRGIFGLMNSFVISERKRKKLKV